VRKKVCDVESVGAWFKPDVVKNIKFHTKNITDRLPSLIENQMDM
jgi:hypothetical protein